MSDDGMGVGDKVTVTLISGAREDAKDSARAEAKEKVVGNPHLDEEGHEPNKA
jgi:hypothetical protein